MSEPMKQETTAPGACRPKWAGVVAFALLMGLTQPQAALADDIAFKRVLRNAFYGGAVGALVGAALLAFKDSPSDHLNFISVGAGAGVLVGTAWGVYDVTVYASLEDGKIHAGLPIPRVTVAAPSAADRGRREAMVTARLAGIRF